MVFNNSILLGAAGQGGIAPFDTTLIGNSVWLDGSSDQLEMAKTSGGSASSKFTVSCWIQRNKFAEATFPGIFNHFFSSNTGVQLTWLNADTLTWVVFSSTSGSGGQITSSEVFRDIGWYHILANYDGTNGTMQLFVNGESVGIDAFTAGSTNPIGSGTSGASYYWGACKNTQGTFNRTNSYLAQCALELGTAAVPSDYVDTFTFGTNGSQVIPKKSSDLVARINSAGGHSHLLDFSTSSDLGNDASSNNNDFTATSMGPANQSVHTPSKVYAKWNPLRNLASSAVTLSDGNLKMSGGDGPVLATKAIPSTGKWVVTGEVNAGDFTLGIATESMGFGSKLGSATSSNGLSFALVDTGVNLLSRTNNTDTNSTSALSVGDKVIAAFDADTGKLWLGSDTGSGYTYLGGGNPATGATPTFTISSTETLYFAGGSAGNNLACDFGQNGFDGTVPSGFESLNSTTLTAPEYQGIDYFDATIYEGNGTGQRVGDFVPFTDSETVANSTIFNDDDSAYLSKIYGTPTASTAFTFSFWFKPGSSTSDQYIISTGSSNAAEGYVAINHSTGGGQIWVADPNNGSGFGTRTAATFTDSSQWYNVCIGIDSTAGTGSRFKFEVNGVEQTMLDNLGGGSLPTEPSSSQSMNLNEANAFNIGRRIRTSGSYFDGYLANVYFIDGEKKQASDFGQLDTSTNRWVAKAYTGSYGNNGFKLAFGTASTGNGNTNGVGTDTSGVGNNWAEQGFTTSDQFTDTPSKNFATWDNARRDGNTLSEGNLKVTGDSGGDWDSVLGTMFVSSGKYYWEVERDSDPAGSDRYRVGVAIDSYPLTTSMDSRTDAWGISENGQKLGGGLALTNYGDSTTTGDFIGVALDMDRNAIYFSKNGTWMNSASASGIADGTDYSKAAFSNVIGSVTPFLQTYDAQVATLRTASGRWEGTAPTGFLELNQDNLDDTASKLTAWSWIKNRDSSDSHMLIDRVRGVGVEVHTDGATTTPETTNVNTVQRFLQRGVQVGSDVQVNTANESYVLWQWLVGNSATTGTSIGAGSISTGVPSLASTVLAADAGHFSVVSWTGSQNHGDTIAHGLGGEPEFIITIARAESGQNKPVYHKFMTSDFDHLKINDANAQGTASSATLWDIDAMSSTLIGLGAQAQSNSSNGMIAYCFRSIPGLCKVGSYKGNNNGDGAYLSLGFTPAWFMARNLSGSSWFIIDNKRGFNSASNEAYLQAESTATETVGNVADLLSDGIKWRTTGGGNATNTILYVAMADLGGNGTLPPIYGR